MAFYFYYDTPLGKITITENGKAVTGISFGENAPHGGTYNETDLIKRISSEITEYFDGRRFQFSVPFEFETGTTFEKSVWQALFDIPYGETRSYKDIAEAIGNPKAARAIGHANNKNPIAICCPCHRVIGKNGSLVGYGGGLDKKKLLLNLEQRQMAPLI